MKAVQRVWAGSLLLALAIILPPSSQAEEYEVLDLALLLTPTVPTAVGENTTPRGYQLSARSSEITFYLPHAGPVALRVFDVGGNLIATLADGVRPSGEHRAVWDGRTICGHKAATGIYLAQLRTPARTMTCRVVLVR